MHVHKIDTVAHLMRDVAIETVVTEIKLVERCEVSHLSRDGARQQVPRKVEDEQRSTTSNGRGVWFR